MPINAGHEYFEAEKKYLAAQTLEEKIAALRELIKTAPKHKSSENLLAELKTRLKKFIEKSEKSASVGKGKKGIRNPTSLSFVSASKKLFSIVSFSPK